MENSEDSREPLFQLLGLVTMGGANQLVIPHYRLTGFLRHNQTNQPLRSHRLESDGISHLTSSSGRFSFYLDPGKHKVRVTDSDNQELGDFSFRLKSFGLGEMESLPAVEYSPSAPFKIVWEGAASTVEDNDFYTGFHLISATASDPTTLVVTFSADPVSGGDTLTNYKIFEGSSCSGTELSVSNVNLTGSMATLTTAVQTEGGNYIICVENMIGGVENFPIVGKSVVFSGYAPTAVLAINELAPGLGSDDDFVEFFVLSGGSLAGLEYCYRSFTSCTQFPDRIVDAGDYIVWYSDSSGTNNQSKLEGNPGFWEFYGIDNPAGTDGVMIVKNGTTIQTAIAYANGNGSWTGCGTTGDTSCIAPVVAANTWRQAAGTWAESDAVRKNPVGSFGGNDTIAKIPNGTGSDSLSTWKVYSNVALRTIGSENIEPVSVARGQIVINELRRESSGSSHWVEFFNRTGQAINMAEAGLYFKRISNCDTNWTSNTTNTVALTGTIPANGYYVLSRTDGIPGNEDQSGNFSSFTDDNCVFLTKSASNPNTVSDPSIVDFVGWGSASAFQGSPAPQLDNSGILQRVPNGNYTEGESHADAFGAVGSGASPCSGTPKADNNLASNFSSNFTTGSPFRTLPYTTGFETGDPVFTNNGNLYDVSQGDSLTDNLTARTGSRFLFGTGITTTGYSSRQIDSNDFIQLSGSSDLTVSAYIARRTDFSTNTIDSRISILWYNDFTGTPNATASSEGGEVTGVGSTYTQMSFTASPPSGAGFFKIRIQVRKSSGSSSAVANTRLAIDDVSASQ